MDTIDRIRIFVRVVDSGTFSGTAAELGLGQPAVSRAVSALEARLGVRLLHRNTRSLSLTEDGERAYERALRVLEEVEGLDGTSAAGAGHRRRVRVACPLAFGTLRFIPMLPAFARAHPEIEVDLRLSDALVDLVEDGIDVAVRFGALADSALAARRLGEVPRIIAASRTYLAARGAPRHPRELASHDCVVRGRQPGDARWHLRSTRGEAKVAVSGPLRVDNFLALREAVLAGAGLGLAGAFVFYEGDRLHPALEHVLPAHVPAPLPMHLVFRRDRLLPTRVRAFIDHLAGALEREAWLSPRPATSASSSRARSRSRR